MKESKNDGKGELDWRVRVWLKRKGYSTEDYDRLSLHYKRMLSDRICSNVKQESDRQLKGLQAGLQAAMGRDALSLSDSATYEELDEYFSPLPDDDKLPELWMY